MKKVFVLIFTLVFLAACSACSNQEEPSKSENPGSAQKEIETKSTTVQVPSRFASVVVGDVITFGRYEQDNDLYNGKESIEWTVLDIQDGNALLLSRYALDGKWYNEEDRETTWETCTLRLWLNRDFLGKAFSEAEQSAILTTDVDNSPAQCYGRWSTSGGNNTQDKLFLLSYSEAHKYLDLLYWEEDNEKGNKASRVAPTAYAAYHGTSVSEYWLTADNNAATLWWLRSPGDDPFRVCCVDDNGSMLDTTVNADSRGVRPALWVNLETAGTIPVDSVSGTAETEATPVAFSGLNVGDTVTFGSYEQDNNIVNGPEPIEWTVLDVRGGKALFISKYGLDTIRYHHEWEKDVTWENCYLRAWLNTEFLETAFNPAERAAILTTEVDNSAAQKFSDWNTDGGSNTKDRVFLLSYAEAHQYYRLQYEKDYGASNQTALLAPTAYAFRNGAYTDSGYKTDGKETCAWWLRTPGMYQTDADCVNYDGFLVSSTATGSDTCVRPAFWVNLNP